MIRLSFILALSGRADFIGINFSFDGLGNLLNVAISKALLFQASNGAGMENMLRHLKDWISLVRTGMTAADVQNLRQRTLSAAMTYNNFPLPNPYGTVRI